jgi:multidrug efflux pump subunit AcrB
MTSRRRRRLVAAVGALAVGLGACSGPQGPVHVVQIRTTVAGISPEDAETRLTQPLELALQSLSSVARTRSVSSDGGSTVWVQVHAATGEEALRQVALRVEQAAPRLPTPREGPTLSLSHDDRLFRD